jgi:hypothetical protein
MRQLRRTLFFSTLFILLLSPVAFAKTTINKINADPGRYHNKKVTIVGTVTDSYGVFTEGGYEIDDGTGKIWVLADRAVPARGARVEVKGRVFTGLVFRGRNMGTAIRETGRKAKD